ncbi:hypothetical protein B0H34DRAFT_796324 [Crassisporium funariophilum]|nr:hypothetical protein B0H34DRAFT_796324 [Crassisporium funariophilum]
MSSTPSASHSVPQYKGKVTHRSWPQLPEEIVRLITTHYLWELSATSYCPQTWDTRKQLWQQRMVYTCIRDSMDLEKHIMAVCPEWHRAIEKHPFWTQAIQLIDPNETLVHNMISQTKSTPTRLSSYVHFHNILRCSCLVCRINFSQTNMGLVQGKRSVSAPYLGAIIICREHDRRRAAFCGLCLRDAAVSPQDATARDYEQTSAIGVNENEDEVTWPRVEATCRKCRSEWLWRRASHNARDREAIGGAAMEGLDWETRQTVDGFLDVGEGTIDDVLTMAREKWWLRKYTKYESLGQHALAAQKSTESGDEEDSDEDKELMLMRDSNQVKEMALHDWARQRILDGHWISPADVWYGNLVPGKSIGARATHPCPWSREGETASDEEEEHPLRSTYFGEIPPSFSLCEQAFIAHMRQMREILLAPMKNIVRKMVMESTLVSAEKGFEDPTVRAAKMTMEDVCTILREEEGVWYDGVDWIERRRNEEEALLRSRVEDGVLAKGKERRRKEDDAGSTTSSSSSSSGTHGSSNATSPVLSTTTLQTTPSPPPLSDEGSMEKTKKREQQEQATPRRPRRESFARPPTILVDPVRSPPQLLRCIPHVPVTMFHMPHYSTDAFRMVWRDACAPLYHCRCSICERAKKAQAEAAAAYAALAAPIVPSQQLELADPTSRATTTTFPSSVVRNRPGEIDLTEAGGVELDGEGEEEVDYDGSDLEEYEDDEEDDNDSSRFEGDDVYSYSASEPEEPEVELEPSPRPRKRSSDELEEEEEEELPVDADEASASASASDSPSLKRRHQGGTPPKRARIGERFDVEEEAATVTLRPAASPSRLRKRSSEELEEGDMRDLGTGNKRAKVERTSPPVESPLAISPGAGGFVKRLSPVRGGGEDKTYRPTSGKSRRICKADMDSLIVLDDRDD